jgi:homoserine dehydrogenase
LSEPKTTLRLALLGCGTVGGGVLRLLDQNRNRLAERIGASLEIKHVLVRDPDKERVEQCRPEWITTDPEAVLGDPEVDVIVEVMGGAEPARAYVERALSAKKEVVTGNKLLIAKHGPALIDLAIQSGVDLAFEASVGGGIPVIRTMREALASDHVQSIHAILNGTCNYILTRMRSAGISFSEALAEAQKPIRRSMWTDTTQRRSSWSRACSRSARGSTRRMFPWKAFAASTKWIFALLSASVSPSSTWRLVRISAPRSRSGFTPR